MDNNQLMNKFHVYLACTDTPSWNDGIGPGGNKCEFYRKEFCRDNSSGRLAGASFNFPEKNCCGCGKGNKIMGILFKA